MGSYPVTAALGRKFRLGMLYDARTDQLLQGSALWDSAVLKSMTRTSPQPHSHFRLSSSDSAEEKASLLEIQPSLRASVLCGFVEGEGSAKFLHDKQQFKNQSRVILQYKASTHFEQLSLTAGDWDNMKDRDMVQRGLATHVVTGIEYGGNVFFVFDSHVVQESELQEFKLKVKAVIHLIFFSVTLIMMKTSQKNKNL
ncbi:hypothetical protein NL108_018613 [Boleophthalmus pectinirostris]|nr:hypothetical protein NL108_018613 [Boleophthalmus pectinirostris]